MAPRRMHNGGQPPSGCGWIYAGKNGCGEMTIYKALLIIRTDGTHDIELMDVIEFDGKFWLVPEWLDNPSLGMTMPARIVSLATIGHNRSTGNPQFTVEDPIPRSVFEGSIPSPEEAHGFVVLERPAIRLPIPPVLN